MDISKATGAFGKYLTNKVANGINAVAKKVTNTIGEVQAFGKDFTDILRKDLEVVKGFDGTDDDVKKMDQLNLFKYLRNLRDDLTGKKRYPSKDAEGHDIMVRKSEDNLIVSRKTRGNLLLWGIVILTFSGLGPLMLLGAIGVTTGMNIRRFIKNGWKSLKAAFGDKQAPVKTSPPGIVNAEDPAPTQQPQTPVNTNTQQGPAQQQTAQQTPPQGSATAKTSTMQQQQAGAQSANFNKVSPPPASAVSKPAPAAPQQPVAAQGQKMAARPAKLSHG